jgi:VWFA-related protein
LPQSDQSNRYENPDFDAPQRSPQRAPASSNQSSGNGSVIFAGGDRSDDAELTIKGGGPLVRPRQERRTESGNSGLRVRIIPADVPLGSPRDTGTSIYDQQDDQDAQMRNRPTAGGRDPIDYDPAGQNRGQSRRTQDRQYDPYDSRGSSAGHAPDFDREPVASGNRSATPPALRRPNEEPAAIATSPVTRPPAESTDEEAIVLKSALVNLNVFVMNRSGATLGNLKKEDFSVFENGESQKVEFFAPSTAPFNLVLVLDLSGSIKDKLDVVKSAAVRFVESVSPQDKVAVVTFTQDVRVVSQLTADRDELKRRIRAIERPEGGTAFYEAMWFSLVDTLRGTAGQRNAIVVMTDGVDSSLDRYNPAPTRVSFSRLAQRLEESDVIVFPVYLDTEYEEVFERGNSTSEAYALARDQLQRVAELTGGQLFKAEKTGDLSGVYKQVAASIRTVYSVGYYPTNAERDGTFRRVRVNVSRADAAVRTRKGYYAK